MRFALALMIASAALVTAPAAAQESTKPSVTYRAPAAGASPWLPYDVEKDSVLFFDGRVNDLPVRGVADTGTTYSSLDRNFARRFGPVEMVDRPVLGPTVNMEVPSYHVKDLQIVALDLSTMSQVARQRIDLLLGMNVLGAGAMELDLANQRWRLVPTGQALPSAATVPLRYTEDHKHNYIEIEVEGRLLRLGMDTGSDAGMTLTAEAATATGLLEHGRPTTMASQGLAGLFTTRTIIPTRLRLGAATISEVSIDIDDGKGTPTQWHMDGMIGTGALKRLHVVLDYPAGVMSYVAIDRAPKPLRRSTTGIQALPQGSGMTVVHVMANGPAEAVGWKAGDAICAVDGVKMPIDPAQRSTSAWSTAAAGTKIRFEMCDGSRRTLTAADFY